MTLENALVLYAHFNSIGRADKAEDLLRRYPELKAKSKKAETKPEVEPEAEGVEDVKVRKG